MGVGGNRAHTWKAAISLAAYQEMAKPAEASGSHLGFAYIAFLL